LNIFFKFQAYLSPLLGSVYNNGLFDVSVFATKTVDLDVYQIAQKRIQQTGTQMETKPEKTNTTKSQERDQEHRNQL
jgi:hypothetical protein